MAADSQCASGEDLYAVLEVNRAADANEIRRSYQRLAKQVPRKVTV